MPRNVDNVLVWGRDVEDATIAQAAKAAALPFIHGHVALMPDAHVGKGSTIGSVIATRGAVIPAAIGVDIGCGMIAVETSLTSGALPDDLAGLHERITGAVPAGMGRGHDRRGSSGDGLGVRHFPGFDPGRVYMSGRLAAKALDQFGSLGGGNHFVELCLDERDVVWVVLHSGSRGVGNELANVHIDGAKALMRRYFIELEDPDLAYLVEGTDEFNDYIAAMHWAQAYALGNREAMMDAVLAELQACLGAGYFGPDAGGGIELQRINTHHNYTERESHGGQNVWLTRKGAVRARAGDRCVIPGSMATGTYIGTGLGSKASYDSCSHGAGRRLSRSAARKTLDVAGLETAMAGRAWNARSAVELLDEDPRAYKDVARVMADQADLVRIDHTLRSVLNYKGVK